MNLLNVAIIIPVRAFNRNLAKAVNECLKLDYESFEIMILPDKKGEEFNKFNDKVKIIPTGEIGPAEKRDLALTHSQADLFAFLDDDAYPQRDWLKNAVRHFENPDVAAVGGPSVTPPESTLVQTASGHALSSVIVAGPYTYRYAQGNKVMEVEDYPSCNFIVRREIFEKLGGFDSSFYPGEDTKLCLEITKKLNKKIVYDPSVLIFHHRRETIKAHMQQMASYAIHRGNFVKRYPETSRKLAYFVPSLFVSTLLIGFMLSLIFPVIRILYFNGVGIYLSIVTGFAIGEIFAQQKTSFTKKVMLIFPVIIDIVGTHICYGIFFINGLLLKKLEEEIR